MRSRFHLVGFSLSCGISVAGASSCTDPTHFDSTARTPTASALPSSPEDCPASTEWLPITSPVALFDPLPHPATECPFYRVGWQNFLIATQVGPDGTPAIVSYPTVDDLFVGSTPHALRNTPQRAWLGDIKQAGGREVLIDQNGHTLYYGIHVNPAFAAFIADNGLRTLQAVQGADPDLFFPAGLVEFKSAWQDITQAPAGADSNYVTTVAWVPRLHQDSTTRQITEDKNDPIQIKVALVALHVVYTLPGHPEFVWTSFQHVGSDGIPDSAPSASGNPTLSDPNNLKNASVPSANSFILYHGGTPANQGNQAIGETDLRLDDATQSFPGQQTSIYRMFPGSKSNSIDPDDAVVSLNNNVVALFARGADTRADPRGNYRLVGGVWMDKPGLFTVDASLQNDPSSPLLQSGDRPDVPQDADRRALVAAGVNPADDLLTNGTDSPFSILAGEDRMSSTAMESFTQSPAGFPNCFSCHDTQAITARGVPIEKDSSGVTLLPPKRLNVSHLFSQFVLEETQ